MWTDFYHWFWFLLTMAIIFWYSVVTAYIAYYGIFDIRRMLNKLSRGEFDPEHPES